MAKVFENSMVAHVWAQMRQDEGKSNNGNFYFVGAKLYSYGSHYLCGFIDSAGVAFLNADSYSISTTRHQSYAAKAVRHRAYFYVSKLTEWRDAFDFLDWRDGGKDSRNPEYAKRWKGNIRKLLLEHALHLTCRRSGNDELEETGGYIARRAGLPAATWPAIKRAALAARAAKAKADIAKAAKADRDAAISYATMSDSEWRDHMRKDSSKYESFYDSEAKALYHAVRYAKAHDFSAKRRAVLKDRRADALARKAGYDGAVKQFKRWQDVRRAISRFRGARELLAVDPALPILSREAATAQAASSLAVLSNAAAFPSAARFRMRAESARLDALLPDLRAELSAYREAERAREQAEYDERMRLNRLAMADRVAAWLEGADVRVNFDAESGGAALRVRGDSLETSHGASVPLVHAVKAFRFVKLVRERGTAWERNGKTIRVGHFQIDRIDANGDFVAGCHRFTWPEVERVAALAGVADEAPDDSAVVATVAA